MNSFCKTLIFFYKDVFFNIKKNIMTRAEYKFGYQIYESIDQLTADDASLLAQARSVTQFAYAPYSNFHVGAYGRLVNGEYVSGTNQENAAYPAGICAERVLLSTASSLYPGIALDTVAISYHNLKGKSGHPVSPCGICRQSFAEFQQRTRKPIRIILSGMEGEVHIIDDAYSLLPFVFGASDMD